MVQFDFSYDTNIGQEQRIGFEMAAAIWSSFLTDDVTVKLRIGATSGLDNEDAVGGAIPILHNQNYGVFNAYYEQDASSDTDRQAIGSLQKGNTVDLLVDNEVIDGNSDIVLTSAQAKALGMSEAISLDNETVWNRNLVDTDALDGYIVVNNSFDWSYDFTRNGNAHEESLDFLSMALHEIGHNLGFVSGLDGLIDITKLHSGNMRVSDFTALDLFRHTAHTATIENADGSISSATIGGEAYFSLDGGKTKLASFSTGKDGSKSDTDFQASHWKRLQKAMGIMDPTLAYKERLSISMLDLQAMDSLGWDIDHSAVGTELDLKQLWKQAKKTVNQDLKREKSNTEIKEKQNIEDFFSPDQDLDPIKEKMLSLGYQDLWEAFELGYSSFWQENSADTQAFELGYSSFWQELESQMFELGYSSFWQEIQGETFELGYSSFWQIFELGYSSFWQEFDTYVHIPETANNKDNSQVKDYTESAQAVVISAGNNDEIIGGTQYNDEIIGGTGDDVIDGQEGNDTIYGEAGNDILYGLLGEDEIFGGEGDDILLGESDDDKLYGEAGADIISGGFGSDILVGGLGTDFLKGDAGNDLLDGGQGNDDVDGGDGDDTAIGGSGEDIVGGGKGNDIIYGDDSSSSINDATSDQNIPKEETYVVVEDKLLEAEKLTWIGDVKQQKASFASQQYLVEGKEYAYATTEFSGESGIYSVVLGYVTDEDDSEFSVWLGDNKIAEKELKEGDDDAVSTQTLAADVFISNGQQITFQIGDEEVEIDYINLVASENNVLAKTVTSGSASTGTAFLIEAESLTFSGSSFTSRPGGTDYSNGQYVSLEETTGSKLFQEETGYYDIVVSYFDYSASSAELSIAVNGQEQGKWQPNTIGSNSFVEQTVASGVKLTQGEDSLQLINHGTGGYNTSYVDYIKLVKVGEPEDKTITNDTTTNSDILTGGQGNDTIYGGEGNDTIYGEDAFDLELSDYEAITSRDTLYGGNGDDTLYGNAGDDTLYGDDEAIYAAPVATTDNGIIYQGSEYVLTDSNMSWRSAQAQATELSGNLVTINNEAEEQWLRDTFGGGQSFWIGINDRASEGKFEWVSGETTDYTNWGNSRLNSYSSQDYGAISWLSNGDSKWRTDHNNGEYQKWYGRWYFQGSRKGLIEIERPDVASPDADKGNDKLEGGRGSDTLKGGLGDDYLDGSSAIAKGISEQDTLIGGGGSDLFILGDSQQSYYLGSGDSDYARIKDFDSTVDVLQLSGSADNYQIQRQNNNLLLKHGQDLVAVLENVTGLDFEDESVTFV